MLRGLSVGVLLAGGACAPVDPDAGTEAARTEAARMEAARAGRVQQGVVGGRPAPDDAAVVALVARRTRCEDVAPQLLCSGALVAPDAVLTAAHCLETLGAEGQYEVFLGARVLPVPEGRFVHVASVHPHPGYRRGSPAHDVALLRLARPVVDVAPLPLPAPGAPPLAVGATARVVGYGETREAAEPAGLRRQGETAVTAVEPGLFRAAPAPSMSCTGDSGGPVLVVHGGREVLAGVTASGDVACRTEAVAVRVDAEAADFLAPLLASPSPAPSPAPLAPEALCRATCTRAADCPAGLACVEDGEGRPRCMLLTLREGAFGGACSSDAACGGGGTCARLESGEDCRCFTPCSPLSGPGAGGCAAGGGAAGGGAAGGGAAGGGAAGGGAAGGGVPLAAALALALAAALRHAPPRRWAPRARPSRGPG